MELDHNIDIEATVLGHSVVVATPTLYYTFVLNIYHFYVFYKQVLIFSFFGAVFGLFSYQHGQKKGRVVLQRKECLNQEVEERNNLRILFPIQIQL